MEVDLSGVKGRLMELKASGKTDVYFAEILGITKERAEELERIAIKSDEIGLALASIVKKNQDAGMTGEEFVYYVYEVGRACGWGMYASMLKRCSVTVNGMACTRTAGHEGPCAAVPVEAEIKVENSGNRKAKLG